MRRSRSFVVLLTCAGLAGAAVPVAQAQSGASDAVGSLAQVTQTTESDAELTDVPQLSDPTTTTQSTTTEADPLAAQTTTSARQRLPNTGLDARVLALLGLALLVLGVGLRFRTDDSAF